MAPKQMNESAQISNKVCPGYCKAEEAPNSTRIIGVQIAEL